MIDSRRASTAGKIFKLPEMLWLSG